MLKKSLLSFSIISLTLVLSGCGETAATINAENLATISKSSAFNEDKNIIFRQNIAQCKNDEVCKGKVFYSRFDRAFESEGFSQIGTVINFLKWSKKTMNYTVTRESAILSRDWGSLIMGTYMCLKNKKCTQWLIDTGKATESEIELYKTLESNLT